MKTFRTLDNGSTKIQLLEKILIWVMCLDVHRRLRKVIQLLLSRKSLVRLLRAAEGTVWANIKKLSAKNRMIEDRIFRPKR